MATDILDTVTPDVYRNNVFRLTGLGTDATQREIRRRFEKLRMTRRLGGEPDDTVPDNTVPDDTVPDNDMLDNDMLDAAERRSRDPVRRLPEELFWIWPVPPGEPGPVARHNTAVLAHSRALEEAGSPEEPWRQALDAWREVQADDAFWDILTERARELADPRLDPAAVRRIRANLPAALLSINVRLAGGAFDDGRWADAAGQVAVIRRSGFDQTTVDDAVHAAAAPVTERIRSLGETAERAAADDPGHAAETVGRFLDQVVPLLDLLADMLPADHAILRGARDEAAGRVVPCVVRYTDATDDWRATTGLLERALSLADTEPTRVKLNRNLEVAQSNLRYGTCHLCGENPADDSKAYAQKMYGNVRYDGLRVTWQTVTIRVPRCAGCAQRTSRVVYALAVAALVLFVLTGVFASGWLALLAMLTTGVCIVALAKGGPAGGDISAFEPIRKRLDDGWRLGGKPPNVN